MKYVKFGNTDMMVSECCAGTMTWGSFNDKEDQAWEQMDALWYDVTSPTPPRHPQHLHDRFDETLRISETENLKLTNMDTKSLKLSLSTACAQTTCKK